MGAKRRPPLWRAAFAAALSLLTLASAEGAGDAEQGAEKAESCKGCHGETGNSAVERIPSLAGQPQYYITMQLILFREKQRQVPEMTPFAEKLTDGDIEDLAAFFAQQKVEPQPGSRSERDEAQVERGSELAAARHCGSCHLPDYAGREQMARLAGQREDYLFLALKDFHAGRRAGFDGTMTSVLYGMNEQELADLAHFLAHR
jgi:cytochrome c553